MADDAMRESSCSLPAEGETEPEDLGLVLVDRELLVDLRRRARGLDRLLDRLLAAPEPGFEPAAGG